MNKIIIFAICLLATLEISSSVNIDCRYSHASYYMLKHIYSCTIRTVTSPEYDQVYINGNHMARKGLPDVIGLRGNIGNVQKFPKGLNNSFPNLQAIHFTNGHIRELVADDLKSFPDLVELYFDRNKIEVVEEGTFDYNPKLAGISFKSNKLFHISPNVFDHLTDLRYLWLNGNPKCPNGATTDSRYDVLNLIEKAKTTCQSAAFTRLQRQVKEVCQTTSPIPTTTPVPTAIRTTTEKLCEKPEPCKKCVNIDDIYDGYSSMIVDLKAQCETHDSQDFKNKIEAFETEYGNMHSMFTHTLHSKFEDMKSQMNCE